MASFHPTQKQNRGDASEQCSLEQCDAGRDRGDRFVQDTRPSHVRNTDISPAGTTARTTLLVYLSCLCLVSVSTFNL